jgi:hypothetical protein
VALGQLDIHEADQLLWGVSARFFQIFSDLDVCLDLIWRNLISDDCGKPIDKGGAGEGGSVDQPHKPAGAFGYFTARHTHIALVGTKRQGRYQRYAVAGGH